MIVRVLPKHWWLPALTPSCTTSLTPLPPFLPHPLLSIPHSLPCPVPLLPLPLTPFPPSSLIALKYALYHAQPPSSSPTPHLGRGVDLFCTVMLDGIPPLYHSRVPSSQTWSWSSRHQYSAQFLVHFLVGLACNFKRNLWENCSTWSLLTNIKCAIANLPRSLEWQVLRGKSESEWTWNPEDSDHFRCWQHQYYLHDTNAPPTSQTIFSPDRGCCLIVGTCRWLLRGQPNRDSRLVVLVYDKDQACPAQHSTLSPHNKFGTKWISLAFTIFIFILLISSIETPVGFIICWCKFCQYLEMGH